MRARGIAIGAAMLVVACKPPGEVPATPVPHPGVTQQFTFPHLVGSWRWLLRTDEAGTSRIEDEHWQLAPSHIATELVGRYTRDVEVRSNDHTPFECNQRPWYRQRAIFDFVVAFAGDNFAIHETGYHTEPGPCDHGFRHLADYTARLAGDRLVVHWGGTDGSASGDQTLWQTSDQIAPLPDAPWPATVDVSGPWRWENSSFDDAGNVHDEIEQWELTRRADGKLDGSYRRRVTVRSPDGSPITCAGAPSWSFDDAYVVEGGVEDEHLRLAELAVDPGDHPCLRATPKRTLDEATAEQIGDYLVLEWRGKRRQVLYRPETR